MEAERNASCWSCKYFIQTGEGAIGTGLCAREAPEKIDEEEGNAGPLIYPPIPFFAAITNAELLFCGDYARMIGEVPPSPGS